MARSPDMGVNWTAVSSLPNTGWCALYFLDRHVLAADKIEPHTFYAFNETNGYYRSQDGGVTWTLMSGPGLDPFGWPHWNVSLRASPTLAEEIFYTSGGQTPGPHPVAQMFHRSQNGGATWTSYADVNEVRAFGFGAPAPGRTNASLWFFGWVNCGSTTIAVTCLPTLTGTQGGVFVSIDDMTSLRQVTGLFPGGWIDQLKVVTGDMNSWGRFYVGFAGSGFEYGVLPDAILKPIVSMENVNTTTPTEATISWLTDTAASNSVDYGLTSAYGSNAPASSGLTPSVTLTGLSNYTLYHYRARTGASASMDLSFHTANNIPPSAPPGLMATVVDDATVNLNWGAATGDPQGVAGYKVYEGGVLLATLGNVLSYSVTGLQPSTTYSFTVSAFDATPNEGPQSTAAVATTPAAGVTWAATDQPNFVPAAALTTSFTGLNVGAPATNKQTLVCASQAQNGDITGVAMNGTPMSLVADSYALGFGGQPGGSSLWRAPAPSGASTANFVVTLSSFVTTSNSTVGMQVGSLITTTPTPTATAVAPWSDGFLLSPPTTIPSFGIAVICDVSLGPIPNMAGTPPPAWINGVQDNNSLNAIDAYLFGGFAHLYSSGSQAPQMGTTGANFFAQAIGVWQP
jgi:hypothetical protein